MGGFLVFTNFMKGLFSKVNGGVYLERCQYGSEIQQGQKLTFSDAEVSAENYKGAHAVAIMGWGIAKNIIVDNDEKRADVPYWYCRNSWDDKWAEGGYFKIAMYPWNKISQFDKRITINDASGARRLGGGIVLIRATKPPELLDIKQMEQKFREAKRVEPDVFYTTDGKMATPSIKDKEEANTVSNGDDKKKKIFIALFILVIIAILVFFFIKRRQRVNKF